MRLCRSHGARFFHCGPILRIECASQSVVGGNGVICQLGEAVTIHLAVDPSKFDTADWRTRMPVELREAAWFSAKVTDLRFLQETYQGVERATSMLRRPGMGKDGGEGAYQTRERYVAEMQALARKQKLEPKDPRDAGTIKDVTSERRLGLIYDTQVKSAQEYARWKVGNDPDVFAAFPAREFLRTAARKQQRTDWPRRWAKASGRMYGGRMIALKTDDTWRKLSVFERPWPPFDFGSGMGWRNISLRECWDLGLIKRGEIPRPPEEGGGFNDSLAADVSKLKPALQQSLQDTFGDQIVIEDGIAKWQGNVIDDLMETAIREPAPKGEIRPGLATPLAQQGAAALGQEIEGYNLTMLAPEVRHIIERHGEPNLIKPGSGEKDPRQIPVTTLDLQAVPWIWREPETVQPGERSTDLVFTKTLSGELTRRPGRAPRRTSSYY